MAAMECALTDSLMRPLANPPVLSIIVPTYCRPSELTLAVTSVASQIDADLDGKVEIIITDNASGPETTAVLKQLAETYPAVNYMIHAQNEGGDFQVLAAPFRARGRWMWVFGDDDALTEGGLKAVVDILEREEPAFLSINRQVWNKAFDTLLDPSRHSVGDQRFDTFLDFLDVFGFDQLSFFTSQVYSSAAARALEPTLYRRAKCHYAQLAYYVEAFHALPAHYMSTAVVRHRWDAEAKDTHQANFHHLATFLPMVLHAAGERAGLDPDLFERIGGQRSLPRPPGKPPVTFVDNILENLWRSVALGTDIGPDEWDALGEMAPRWRPDRAAQLATVREVYTHVISATVHYHDLVAQFRRMTAAPIRTQAELDMAEQMKAAVKKLEGDINEARRFAVDLAGQFN